MRPPPLVWTPSSSMTRRRCRSDDGTSRSCCKPAPSNWACALSIRRRAARSPKRPVAHEAERRLWGDEFRAADVGSGSEHDRHSPELTAAEQSLKWDCPEAVFRHLAQSTLRRHQPPGWRPCRRTDVET